MSPLSSRSNVHSLQIKKDFFFPACQCHNAPRAPRAVLGLPFIIVCSHSGKKYSGSQISPPVPALPTERHTSGADHDFCNDTRAWTGAASLSHSCAGSEANWMKKKEMLIFVAEARSWVSRAHLRALHQTHGYPGSSSASEEGTVLAKTHFTVKLHPRHHGHGQCHTKHTGRRSPNSKEVTRP